MSPRRSRAGRRLALALLTGIPATVLVTSGLTDVGSAARLEVDGGVLATFVVPGPELPREAERPAEREDPPGSTEVDAPGTSNPTTADRPAAPPDLAAPPSPAETVAEPVPEPTAPAPSPQPAATAPAPQPPTTSATPQVDVAEAAPATTQPATLTVRTDLLAEGPARDLRAGPSAFPAPAPPRIINSEDVENPQQKGH